MSVRFTRAAHWSPYARFSDAVCSGFLRDRPRDQEKVARLQARTCVSLRTRPAPPDSHSNASPIEDRHEYIVIGIVGAQHAVGCDSLQQLPNTRTSISYGNGPQPRRRLDGPLPTMMERSGLC